jgi:hypothetical protein
MKSTAASTKSPNSGIARFAGGMISWCREKIGAGFVTKSWRRRKMNCPHCGVDIDEHEASRCLDAWVAEAVIKDIVSIHMPDGISGPKYPMIYRGGDEYKPPDYSTSIAAAWEVVEYFHNKQYPAELMGDQGHNWDRWDFRIWSPVDEPDITEELAAGWDYSMDLNNRLASAPLAICRAAIKATLSE